MNARAYFTILRPVHSIVITLFGFCVWAWLNSLFHVSQGALFYTLAIFSPVFLGSVLLGPIHEVMHRSFSAVLPGARLTLLKWHLGAVSLTALLLSVASVRLVRTIPAVALIGLIIAGLALPVLNNRKRWKQLPSSFFTFLLFGVILAASARTSVVIFCQQSPWIVLLMGIGCACSCFRIGFLRRNVQERWREPNFFCFQSMVPLLCSDMILHAASQQAQLAQKQTPMEGTAWSVCAVSSSLRDWIAVVYHARFGRISRFRHLIQLSLSGLGMMPFIVGISYLGSKLSLPELCRLLVEAGKPRGSADHQALFSAFMLFPVFASSSALLAVTRAIVPAANFPIARPRLAACMFINAGLLSALVLAAYLLGAVVTMVAASSIVGVPFEPGMLQKSVASFLILPPLIATGLRIVFMRNAGLRFIASAIFSLGTLFATVAIAVRFAPWVTSPHGLLVCAAATVIAAWLSWRAARNYYGTCDLTCPIAWIKKLGIGVA